MKALLLAIELHVWLVLALVEPSTTFTVWSYEVPGGGPKHAHTWATFNQGEEVVVISWGPLGVVRPLGSSEQGRNYTHEQTLAFAKQFGAEVKQFGPFHCSADLFGRARVQKVRLESGLVGYKAMAVCFGPHRANCYTAVVRIGRGAFAGGTEYGYAVSRRVADHLLRSDLPGASRGQSDSSLLSHTR